MNIFNERVVEPDLEWEFIDGSIVKAHQHSSGAAHGQESAIGKSVAGNTTKIHMPLTLVVSQFTLESQVVKIMTAKKRQN